MQDAIPAEGLVKYKVVALKLKEDDTLLLLNLKKGKDFGVSYNISSCSYNRPHSFNSSASSSFATKKKQPLLVLANLVVV